MKNSVYPRPRSRCQFPEGFEVEWCSRLKRDKATGDPQYDISEYSVRYFPTNDGAGAMKFAKDIAAHADGVHVAQVRRYRLDQYGAPEWVGDMVEVEADA